MENINYVKKKLMTAREINFNCCRAGNLKSIVVMWVKYKINEKYYNKEKLEESHYSNCFRIKYLNLNYLCMLTEWNYSWKL